MWPFKRKSKTVNAPKEESISTSCIAKTILDDIRNCSIEGWVVTSAKIAEKFSHPQLKYVLMISSHYKDKTHVGIEGVCCSFLSDIESLEIKTELTRIKQEQKRLRRENIKKVEIAKLAKLFPNCVK